MTFLPIVRRELHVAAQRKLTFRVRFFAAAAGAALGAVFLVLSLLPVGLAPSGRSLFDGLVAGCFGLAALAGVMLTADCLSREKRDGTLGFLFLTDLTGIDIIAGKFAALSLLPLHGILAVFPVAGMTVFLGGVTGEELGRVLLVLVNTLFLSLAVGMWISSLVVDDRQAIGLTLLLLAVITLVPVALLWLSEAAAPFEWLAWGAVASPLGALQWATTTGTGSGSGRFWIAMLIQHAMTWALLGMATLAVHDRWRWMGESETPSESTAASAEPGKASTHARSPRRRGKEGAEVKPRRLNLEGHLARMGWESRWIRGASWWVTGLAIAGAIATFGVLGGVQGSHAAGERAMGVVGGGLYLLKFLLALHTVHSLQDRCRSGVMELLLVTPVSSRALFEGHQAAIRHAFLGPFLALAAVQVMLGVLGRLIVGGADSVGSLVLAGLVPAVLTLAVHALDLVAVGCHASRWALHYDRPAKAVLRTTILILLLPAVFCSYGRLVVDLIAIGQTRPLLERFRELARGWFFRPGLEAAFGPPRQT